MSRRLAITAATAVALASWAPAVAHASGGPGAEAAADPCRWTLHSKRVTKRKRVVVNGERRFKKVKRTKRWWSCDPFTDPPLAPTPPNRLLVTANDNPFRFNLSRTNVSAGVVTVQVYNGGEDEHDLHMVPEGETSPEYSSGLVAPEGGLAEVDFDLTAGDWYLWCDVTDHEALGMNATLVVDP
jgi:plastocyanin